MCSLGSCPLCQKSISHLSNPCTVLLEAACIHGPLVPAQVACVSGMCALKLTANRSQVWRSLPRISGVTLSIHQAGDETYVKTKSHYAMKDPHLHNTELRRLLTDLACCLWLRSHANLRRLIVCCTWLEQYGQAFWHCTHKRHKLWNQLGTAYLCRKPLELWGSPAEEALLSSTLSLVRSSSAAEPEPERRRLWKLFNLPSVGTTSWSLGW